MIASDWLLHKAIRMQVINILTENLRPCPPRANILRAPKISILLNKNTKEKHDWSFSGRIGVISYFAFLW